MTDHLKSNENYSLFVITISQKKNQVENTAQNRNSNRETNDQLN